MVWDSTGDGHQIVLFTPHGTGKIAVSCTCLNVGRRYGHVPLAQAVRLPATDAIRIWRAHTEGHDDDDGIRDEPGHQPAQGASPPGPALPAG